MNFSDPWPKNSHAKRRLTHANYLKRYEVICGKEIHFKTDNIHLFEFSLESMNNLNTMLTIHLGHIAILADKIDDRLLTIKIIYASKSLKQNSIVWLSQIAKGIKNILSYAHRGIKEWMNIEQREKYKQLELKL